MKDGANLPDIIGAVFFAVLQQRGYGLPVPVPPQEVEHAGESVIVGHGVMLYIPTMDESSLLPGDFIEQFCADAHIDELQFCNDCKAAAARLAGQLPAPAVRPASATGDEPESAGEASA